MSAVGTTPKLTFTVTGRKTGYGAVTIGWVEGKGFVTDPSGAAADAITLGTVVSVTATGPDYPAADRPAPVALLTAKQILDEITGVDDPHGIERELQALGDIPPGAIS